jgi:hypothetical protein
MNPYLFIVGCPRSGTTLLRRMVDAHPRIAIVGETHWIPEVVRGGRGLDIGGRVTAKLPPVLLSHPKFPTLGIEREQVERLAAGRPSYPAFVAALFDVYGARCGKPIVGDETPGYVKEIGLLHDAFPYARFLHLVRDGRNVCLSALAGDTPVTAAASWWRSHVLEGREQGRRLDPRLYVELQYEALVLDPEAECRRVCAFLDIEFHPAMLGFREGRTRFELDWRTRMAREDIEAFEAVAGDALDAFGYPRAATAGRT